MKNGSKSELYEVTPIDKSDKRSYKAALNELSLMQLNVVTNYQTWAKERVKYNDINSIKSASELKECNDAYTLSMLTNCLTPFNEGITIGALMSSWFTYKSAQMINPSFNQDVSRLMINMRDNMTPMLTENAKSGSMPMRIMSKACLRYFDSNVVKTSSNLMHNEIIDSINHNTLDDMVMTPRQIAAIKLNFMEQCYADMHEFDASTEDGKLHIDNIQKQYDTAVKHLDIIAHNGGFDMSAVAAEERYLVSLKINETPAYANIFNQTATFYGAKPYSNIGKNMLTGDFMTWEEKEYYTVKGNDHIGAFTVRQPQTKEQLQSNFNLEGMLYGCMITSLNSDDSIVPENIRHKVKAELKDTCNSSITSSILMIQSDIGVSSNEANDLYHKSFNRGASTVSDEAVTAFNSEFERILNKKLCAEIAPNVKCKRFNTLSEEQQYFSDCIKDYCLNVKGNRALSVGDYDKILSNMRTNMLNKMSSDDLSVLMLHAAQNVKQTYTDNNYKSYSKYYNASSFREDASDTINKPSSEDTNEFGK